MSKATITIEDVEGITRVETRIKRDDVPDALEAAAAALQGISRWNEDRAIGNPGKLFNFESVLIRETATSEVD
ncbi:MAG: hypothetical protein LBO00_01720 [Zoogloeaceae bacterium]|jgi:hypothetical protein|nr:hypothetical protein [Zoogloeaceae bacterium]